MSEETRHDIRRLLKTFGVQADEAITGYLEHAPGSGPLILRLTLEDITGYEDKEPVERLHLEVTGQVRR